MIEKMKFLSITGPKEDIDRVVDTYLSRYEIHLENALSELKTVKDLRPYIETNPYKDVLEKAQGLVESYHDLITDQTDRNMKLEEAVEVINSLDTQLKELTDQKNALVHQRDGLCSNARRRETMYGWSTLCRRAWRTRLTPSMHPCILSGVSFRMSTRALLWRQDMYWTTG